MFRRRWAYRAATTSPLLASPFPLRLPGLVAWYDPTQETGWSDLQQMTQLRDFSGNGYHATVISGERGPIYEENVQNGLPVFNVGASAGMEIAGLAHAASNWTVYAILLYLIKSTGDQRLLDDKAEPLTLFLDRQPIPEYLGCDTADGETVGAVGIDTTWQVVSWRFRAGGGFPDGSPGAVDLRRSLDGAGGATTTLAGSGSAFPSGGAALNAPGLFSQQGGSGHYVIANVGDVLIYDQAHTLAQVGEMHTYLYEKWGLT